MLKAIWAENLDGIIGHVNTIPWDVPEDLAHFKQTTLGEPIIMGRNTWESLPFKPLPGRRNYVLSTRSEGTWSTGATVVKQLPKHGWIIGGGRVYANTLDIVQTIERTLIDAPVAADKHTVYAPKIPAEFKCISESEWRESKTGVRYKFQTWQRAE